jgi:ATPase family protein associated with various cellular activities (AAA)
MAEFEMERNALVAFLQDLVARSGEKKPTDKAFANIDASIEYSGKKIVLPADPRNMTLLEAREWLTRLEQAEDEVIRIHEVIDAHPWDGCVAFMQAMRETYGWASPTPTGPWWNRNAPTMISIETGISETASIFWGGFKLPGVDGQLMTGTEEKRGQIKFVIQGQTKRRHIEMIHGLAELTRQIVRERSIYRGHAIKLALNGGAINLMEPPTFMNLKRVRENELVFSDDLMDQVVTNLWTPIEQTAWCRLHDVPLKRGVLLEGPYGTGKTLAATVTAKKCETNGWTFITVGRVSALESALQFAINYQPCVVFVEDIDREMAGERTPQMDDILNKVDGIISKGSEIMVVLTSNKAGEINRAMLRPGRLDAVLHIGAPDAGAVQKLLRVYGRKLIKSDEDLSGAGEALAGRIPAVIREVVERSKLYAIGRAPGAEFNLTDADIVRSAKGMAHHLALLDGEQPAETTPAERLANALGDVVVSHPDNHALVKKVRDIEGTVDDIEVVVERIRSHLMD